MATLILTSATTLYGTAFSTVAPGPGNPTVAGTITSSTDYTDHIRQVALNMNVAMQDLTTFGDGAFISQKPGLKGADITVTFNQDFAAANVDSVMGAAFLAGTLTYWDFKPTSAARGTGNPSYVYACYIATYPAIGQTVGDAATVDIGLAVTGTYARLTA